MRALLALVTDCYGGNGGLAQANRDVFEALAAIVPVDVLPRLAEGVSATPAGVSQRKAPRSRSAYVASAFARAWAGRDRYAAVFCGHLHLAPLAEAIHRSTGLPYWLHLHGIEAWRPPSAFLGTAPSARLVTAVSRYTRRRFLSWSEVDPGRCRLLPDTYDARFAPGPRSRQLVERYGLAGHRVILTVGRLSSSERYKGHDRLIVLMPRILEKVPEALYVIAGGGDDRPYLASVAERCGVSSKVRFIGRVPDEDLPDLYRSSDLYVMPSTGEGFGIVFLEAAACGLPVIGGRLDGSADALRDGLAGTLVDPGNMDELLKAVVGGLQERGAKDVSVFAKPAFAGHARALWGEFFADRSGSAS
ncbi:MAG: D-inositol-3-phosphate glycosyltransferase [Candidatus Omnitrophica bacterium]|nr:D-inositol-3-phosphate glycosyltransferase [Candidatus Omnitrophota bacterium]